MTAQLLSVSIQTSFTPVVRILIILFIFAIPFKNSARNRIATAADQAIYGDYITPGDLIIDTPTKVTNAGSEVIYYFMHKQWPTLRDDVTIWLDGEKLGFINIFKFCNTASAMQPWHISSAHFKNIPNTQVRTGAFFCQGLKNFELNGESSDFPGLSVWPASRSFLTGSFGFHIISGMFGGHGIHVSVLDGGTIKLHGFESQHGFSAVRINGGDYDITVDAVDMTNFYIHDTGDGEGIYLGATHKPPFAKIKNVRISNGIFTRTAAEAMQLQHLVGGTEVHNVVIRAADVRWMNEFRAGQDTGIQWSIDDGENALHHVIVDGFASVGLVPFSSDLVNEGAKSHVHDVLFNDGIDTGIYLHKSGSFGVQWIFENIYYSNFKSERYHEGTGRPERRFIVSAKHGTDQYIFKNIIHDGSKPKVFQDEKGLNIQKTEYKDFPVPEYVNSGFHERASQIKQWHQFYAGYFPASKSGKIKIPTTWQKGDIAIETKGEYAFYKCIVGHASTELRPGESSNFMKLTWDENGVRSDQPAWNPTSQQSNFPPDDLRLKENSYWDKKGYGIYNNKLLTSKGTR